VCAIYGRPLISIVAVLVSLLTSQGPPYLLTGDKKNGLDHGVGHLVEVTIQKE